MTLHSRDVQKRLLVSASDIKRNQCPHVQKSQLSASTQQPRGAASRDRARALCATVAPRACRSPRVSVGGLLGYTLGSRLARSAMLEPNAAEGNPWQTFS